MTREEAQKLTIAILRDMGMKPIAVAAVVTGVLFHREHPELSEGLLDFYTDGAANFPDQPLDINDGLEVVNGWAEAAKE